MLRIGQKLNLPRNEGIDVIGMGPHLLAEHYEAAVSINESVNVEAIIQTHEVDGHFLKASEARRIKIDVLRRREYLNRTAISELVAATQSHSSIDRNYSMSDALLVSRIEVPGLTDSALRALEGDGLIHRTAVKEHSSSLAHVLGSVGRTLSVTSRERSTLKPTASTHLPTVVLNSHALRSDIKINTVTSPKGYHEDRTYIQTTRSVYTLQIPVLVVQHTKPYKSAQQTFEEAQMQAIACIKFMCQLGVSKHAVFGLATEGPIGRLFMCWIEEPPDAAEISAEAPRVSLHFLDLVGLYTDIDTVYTQPRVVGPTQPEDL